MKVKEIISESAYGDWQLGPLTVSYITKLVISRFYQPVGDIKLSVGNKKIFKLNSSEFYVVGEFVQKGDQEKFETIFEIQFDENHQVESVKTKNNNLFYELRDIL